MPANPDFFSPEYMDEHLELPVPGRASGKLVHADPNTQLVRDLRSAYNSESAENQRSLQNVWERLAAENTRRQNGAPRAEQKAEERLYLLKPRKEIAPVTRKVRSRRPNAALSALAAVLFLAIMVGSLLALVHITRNPPGPGAGATSTTTPPQDTPTPIPGYPYPAPGETASISLPSAGGFSGLTWSPDSKQVAASSQGKIWIWGALASGQPLVSDTHISNRPAILAWSPGAPRLAVGSNKVQLIDPGNASVQHTYSAYPTHNGTAYVTALAWSPDGTHLAVASHDPVSGNTVFVWDLTTGSTYAFTGQRTGEAISSVSWSSDGLYIASANGQSVQAWDATNGGVVWNHAIPAATNVAWSPAANNAYMLAFADGKTTEVWNIWGKNLVSSYPDTSGGILAWSPDGKYLASASGKSVVIWDVNSGAHLYTYTGHTHAVSALAWSPDGNYLASGESSSTGGDVVRVWSA